MTYMQARLFQWVVDIWREDATAGPGSDVLPFTLLAGGVACAIDASTEIDVPSALGRIKLAGDMDMVYFDALQDIRDGDMFKVTSDPLGASGPHVGEWWSCHGDSNTLAMFGFHCLAIASKREMKGPGES